MLTPRPAGELAAKLCFYRITGCRYERIGCSWRGPHHELANHETGCPHPNRTGSQVLDAVCAIDARKYGEMALFRRIFDLLSFQKIAQSGQWLRSLWWLLPSPRWRANNVWGFLFTTVQNASLLHQLFDPHLILPFGTLRARLEMMGLSGIPWLWRDHPKPVTFLQTRS